MTTAELFAAADRIERATAADRWLPVCCECNRLLHLDAEIAHGFCDNCCACLATSSQKRKDA